ncbi:MAG: hypothetical protein IT561_11540 [Alphaproteobacteria bacterium]|nr:hypothetical protein [Alphaproteobacteria bacterium]
MTGRRAATDTRTMVTAMGRASRNARDGVKLAGAAATVVGRRAALGYAAMADPASTDHAEALRMVAEKAQAAWAAGGAAMARAPGFATRAAAFAVGEGAIALRSAARIAACRTPAALLATQMDLASAAAGRLFSFYLGMGAAMLTLGGAMTAPALRLASANARRLG